MQGHQKRVRVALAVSVGVHLLVFGGLAFWILPKTRVSLHSQPVMRIDTAEEAIPKPEPKPQPVVAPVSQSIEKATPIPFPIAVKEPAKPVAEAVVKEIILQKEIIDEVGVPTLMGGDRAATLSGGAATPSYQAKAETPFSAIVQPARYRRNPPPVYPATSRRLGQEGMVLLAVQVDEAGRPTKIKIKTSSGFQLLDTAAQKAVSRWEFIPAQSTKGVVASEVEVPVQFKLDAR